MSPQSKSLTRSVFGLVALATAAAGVAWWAGRGATPVAAPDGVVRPAAFQLLGPDPLDGGAAWLNTGGPIKLRELRGKIVLLDFWTYCCINCHHVLPDLAKLEEKYKNQLVVIGVHTPKFNAERDLANVRQKVREYGIKHPVVSDADQTIWNRFEVSSWPTLVLIDPEGHPVGSIAGEGHYAILDEAIGKLVKEYHGKLNETPVQFFPENEKPDNTPLLYPGKVVADAEGKRLFVSDTGHNRLVVTDLGGKNPTPIGDGTAGFVDGPFEKARFHRPQGMTLVGQTLYVADTENHAVRAVDLKEKTVTTVAGTGQQARGVTRTRTSGVAKKTPLNSPWDLTHLPDSKVLYIAMAGPHQIWKLDLKAGQVGVWAGTGMENIVDGSLTASAFAQPSGLANDGKSLYVADSEGSCVRAITPGTGHQVSTLAGDHDVPNVLFSFGDIDGRGAEARFQHCLGVAYGDGKLYVADTYNNKVKVCDPTTGAVESFLGTGKPGDSDKPAQFYQPGGLSVGGSKLYVADTNNHAVRVVDLNDNKVETLELAGLTPPEPRVSRPVFRNAVVEKRVEARVGAGGKLTLDVTLPIEPGMKLNEGGSMPVLVETPGVTEPVFAKSTPPGKTIQPPAAKFSVDLDLARAAEPGDQLELKVSVSTLVCKQGSNLCMIKSFVWPVTLTFARGGGVHGRDRRRGQVRRVPVNRRRSSDDR